MAWLYIDDTGTGYPTGWRVTSLTVCADAWHSAGVGNALNLRVKEFGPGKVPASPP